MQQWYAERGPTLPVRGKTSALAEQLLSPMEERIADHPGRRSKADAQIVVMGDQDDAVEALDLLA
jgi:hypothetical protein